MQISYLINSTTLVESFNHNFVFFSIISVATFKLTCLSVSRQNYDAVKDRRNTLLLTLFVQLFVLLFSTFISHSNDTSTVTCKTDFHRQIYSFVYSLYSSQFTDSFC